MEKVRSHHATLLQAHFLCSGQCAIAPAAQQCDVEICWQAGQSVAHAACNFLSPLRFPCNLLDCPVVDSCIACSLVLLHSALFAFAYPFFISCSSSIPFLSSPPSGVILRARLARDRPHHWIDDEDWLSCGVTEEETRHTKGEKHPRQRHRARFEAGKEVYCVDDTTTPRRKKILHGSAALYNNPASLYDKEKTTTSNTEQSLSTTKHLAWHIDHRYLDEIRSNARPAMVLRQPVIPSTDIFTTLHHSKLSTSHIALLHPTASSCCAVLSLPCRAVLS